ncbi:hypothetical protein A3D45_03160 [Candidatus Falkowbacteria bacterium RIFCSPHIGHO2_02_FULL_42_9]|uniref:Uncharacterized protein n=2 Tax=Candidatus Falkowiibacteriota TaxID=1752728 RepID=A0A1F5SAS4_9BACT|nr:MAG: hypothetical protein A3D45_03160 [Candidatus Falkowbacteria bacterium RIFCSPHIGHO2_02_FULL_42_9]
MTIKNMPEQIPQKSNKPESLEEKPKSFEWLSGMLAHYVGHFLLLSREMEKYHARHLEKSKEMVKVMRERVDDAGLNSVLLADLISALDKLQDELENIDLQSSKVDKSLLDSIQKIENEVDQIIKTKKNNFLF